MATTKVVGFFLLISSMIFSTYAVDLVLLTDGIGRFKLETTIITIIGSNRLRQYGGCEENDDEKFDAENTTMKIIIYIERLSKLKLTTLKACHHDKRVGIAQKLSGYGYQLLYLGVNNFGTKYERFIVGEFLQQKIKYKGRLRRVEMDTLADGDLNLQYVSENGTLAQYEEEPRIYNMKLKEYIQSMIA